MKYKIITKQLPGVDDAVLLIVSLYPQDGVNNTYSVTYVDAYRTPVSGIMTANELLERYGVDIRSDKRPTIEEIIEEAKSKVKRVTVTYPCWEDGERIISKYCIGRGIEAYTEKEAIAQYVKEKVLEIL